PVVPLGREEMHGLPAGEHQQERGNGADQERHHRHHRIGLDEPLGLAMNGPPGDGAGPEERDGGRGHRAPPGSTRAWLLSATGSPASSTTMTRPTIMWWPMPQNSLQMTRKSPDAVGVTRSP